MPAPSKTRKAEGPIRFDTARKGVLDGVRVIDASRLVAGNMLSLQLADFGADVIKVESPKGDTLRDFRDAGQSFWWKTYGRNKRSLALDLKQADGKAILLRLVEGADVFIESYRPGTLEAMGLGPDRLHERNPSLIVVRISGFGQTGPYAPLPGFGALVEAMAGFADRNGFPDRVPALAPMALGDMTAGLAGALGTALALLARGRTGATRQVIDLSLLEPLVAALGPEAGIYRHTGQVKKRSGSRSNTVSPRNVYRCSGGEYVALAGSTEAMARRIFGALGMAALLDDPRFSTNTARLKNRETVDAMVAEWFAKRTREEALSVLRAAEVSAAPVNSIADMVDDPHFKARDIFVDVEDADFGTLPMHNMTPRLSETPGVWRRPAPKLGEHSDEVLAEFGYSADEISRLRAAGTVV